ncbi:unnamed protein product, partial [Effrenium voratum]
CLLPLMGTHLALVTTTPWHWRRGSHWTSGQMRRWQVTLRRAALVASTWAVCWCFMGRIGGVSAPGTPERSLRLRPQRRLLGTLMDPSAWQRDQFVCETLDGWLPSVPPKTSLVALEIEPLSSRYWPYLRPADCKWYMDKIFAVGELITTRIEEKAAKEMKATAEGMRAKLEVIEWKKRGLPIEVKPGSVDLGLMADGAFQALGPKRTEAALKRMHIMLKNSGRFYIVANQQDEQFGFRGDKLDLGFEPELLRKLGWQIRSSKRDHGLVVAYLCKRRVKTVKRPRTAFKD